MKSIYAFSVSYLICILTPILHAQDFAVTRFQLDNGLTVFLSEDPNATQVFGAVMVNAGGKHDPADATGIAHYLEHLLFKGTTEMGTLDYEKEKPHLEAINQLYDELSKAKTEEAKSAIQAKINEHAVAASQYGLPNEFDKLLKSIGSTGVNAFTSYEMTFYHNSFPPNQIIKWLDLYAHRFQDPVFRSFQSELEVVYEEKNRGMDDLFRRVFENFQKYTFPTQPYGTQTVLGSVEHLKNPSLNKMYDYFRKYYVAGNMALILCGNFDSETIIPVIKKKFAALRTGEAPPFPDYTKNKFNGKEKVKVRLTPIKAGFLSYKTVPITHPDREALEVCNDLLFNEGETGLINRLQLDNKLMFSGIESVLYNGDGASMAFFVPKILIQSLNRAENLVLAQMEKVRKGEFDEDMLNAVKSRIYVDFQQSLEDLRSRGEAIGQAFNMGVSWEHYLAYPKRVDAVTKEDVMRVAAEYYGDDFLAMYSRMGFPKKPKLDKPPYKPVVTNQKESSLYAKHFAGLETLAPKPRFVDFERDVDRRDLANGNRLYLSKNPVNDIFRFDIYFQKGTEAERDLAVAALLMNYSGAADLNLNQVKEKFAALGARYRISADLNYTMVTVTGIDRNFPATLALLNKLITEPKPGPKSMDLLLNETKTLRRIEKNTPSSMGTAMINYGIYGKESRFVRRHSAKEIKRLKPEALIASFKDASGYMASIHYSGALPAGQVKKQVDEQLKLPANGKKADLVYREGNAPKENIIYFLHNKKAVQSQVYFFQMGKPFAPAEYPQLNAFNTYFGDGFNGLVLQEIREYRSLAYSAWGRYYDPAYDPTKKGRLLAYIGCQADKTTDAIGVMKNLLTDLPAYEERMPVIREGLRLKSYTDRPGFRELSRKIEEYELLGYKNDPNKTAYETYETMSFDEIMEFYESRIKGGPVAITIYGDKRKIDSDALKKFGKVVEVKRREVWVK